MRRPLVGGAQVQAVRSRHAVRIAAAVLVDNLVVEHIFTGRKCDRIAGVVNEGPR